MFKSSSSNGIWLSDRFDIENGDYFHSELWNIYILVRRLCLFCHAKLTLEGWDFQPGRRWWQANTEERAPACCPAPLRQPRAEKHHRRPFWFSCWGAGPAPCWTQSPPSPGRCWRQPYWATSLDVENGHRSWHFLEDQLQIVVGSDGPAHLRAAPEGWRGTQAAPRLPGRTP